MGTIFTGKIVNLDESAAVIEVPGYTDDEAIAVLRATRMEGRRYREGNAARVEVVEERKLKNGRVILEVKAAARGEG